MKNKCNNRIIHLADILLMMLSISCSVLHIDGPASDAEVQPTKLLPLHCDSAADDDVLGHVDCSTAVAALRLSFRRNASCITTLKPKLSTLDNFIIAGKRLNRNILAESLLFSSKLFLIN